MRHGLWGTARGQAVGTGCEGHGVGMGCGGSRWCGDGQQVGCSLGHGQSGCGCRWFSQCRSAVPAFSPGTKEVVVRAQHLGQGGGVLAGGHLLTMWLGVPSSSLIPYLGLVTVNPHRTHKHLLRLMAMGRNTAHQLIPLPSLKEFLQANALYVS